MARMIGRRAAVAAILFGGLGLVATPLTAPALAQSTYSPGASDTEIKIGSIFPYSGPASSFSVIGKVEAAYFRKINDEGGINGRKINFISYDDAYNPAKAVEQTRKLVESDEVLLMFNPLGTPSNTAIQKYLNGRQVPQLFVATGATKWADPERFPWTMGWQPSYRSEAAVYARLIMRDQPQGKVGVLYQNDDFGKDYLDGLKRAFGGKAAGMIVAEAPYELTDATIDQQILKLRAAGADVLVNIATPKFAAQAIRKTAELGWKPAHYLANVSQSVTGVMRPAGLENGKGIISSYYLKEPTDPTLRDDPGIKEWHAFLDAYYPDADRGNMLNLYGYAVAQTLVAVLRQAGDNLTRENVMKQAANLKGLRLEALPDGITINTSPTDYEPIKALQPLRFDGTGWTRLGPVLSGAPAP